ncbi:MAG TPA: outer membrane beta-barrel protein [Verrucomicrobiae bacterium]
MKKIVASVGLVALGASGLQIASAQDVVGPDTSKPWSISATLRGFYDDNPGTVENSAKMKDRDSFGFEVSPEFALAWSMQQTTINLGLLYSLRYYENIPTYANGMPARFTEHADQVFTFSIGLTHAFSEQVRLRLSDSFVIGQEPDVLRAGNTYSTFYRASGDNIRNSASLGLDAQLAPKLGLGFGYDNSLYDYKNSGGSVVSPSLSGLLDRMEHRAHLEGLYQLGPETKGILGYQFSEIDYTGDEFVAGDPFSPSTWVQSDIRNTRGHTVYVGAEHNFTRQMSGSVRVGGTYTDYYNNDGADASWTPYVNASLKYAYAAGSSASIGFSYDRNATDVIALDAESAVIFASVTHQLDARLFLNAMAQFQNSTYNGGTANNESEQYYLAGLNLEYKFNQYLSGHVGYNYDRLESDMGRTFDRNRVYLGVTARY